MALPTLVREQIHSQGANPTTWFHRACAYYVSFFATLRKPHELAVQQWMRNFRKTSLRELRRGGEASGGEVLATWFHDTCGRWRSHALHGYQGMFVNCWLWSMNSFAVTLREQPQQRRNLDNIRSAIWFHAACQIHSAWCEHARVVGET